MTVEAVGTYLRTYIELSGQTLAAVTKKAGVVPYYIWNLESGDSSRPSAVHLAAITEAAGANWDHVRRLLKNSATQDYARQLAKDWYQHTAGMGTDEREERVRRATALIDDLLANPDKLDRLLGYGERLREE